MGLLTLYLQERTRRKDFEQRKAEFQEEQKYHKAQEEINKQNADRLMRQFMENVSSKYTNISPTTTTPEGQKVRHPFLQETGIAPDFSRATFGEGEPQVQVPSGMFGDWYKALQERRQGETEFGQELQKIEHTQIMKQKYPTGGGDTYYEIWKSQQPSGSDTSLETFKKSTAQSVLNPKPLTAKDIRPESITTFQNWEKTYKSNPYIHFERWIKATKSIPEGFKEEALNEAKAYWGIK